jgi:hypothetical protein
VSSKAGYRERLHVQDRGRGRSSVESPASVAGAGAGYGRMHGGDVGEANWIAVASGRELRSG